ncbi:MAG: hypothetical protein COA79_15125 [Planctomycetota bacterium]|nr:MAG: hypothetical protein COA79_15125 [Planctomycetota bacterium]
MIKKILIILVLAFYSLSLYSDVVVVASKKCKLDSADVKLIKNIYLGKKRGFSGIEYHKDSKERIKFSMVIFRKTPSKVNRYYLKRSLTGKGQPPKVIKDIKKLKLLLVKTPTLIAYIDEKDLDDDLKVLLKLK